MFDHFIINITAVDNCSTRTKKSSRRIPKTLYRAKQFQFNNRLFALNRMIDALGVLSVYALDLIEMGLLAP